MERYSDDVNESNLYDSIDLDIYSVDTVSDTSSKLMNKVLDEFE